MMKNYRITVNGNTYDVQVEELNGAVATKAPTVTQATPVATPAPVAAPAAAPAPANTGSEGSAKVTSPMPGNILDIKVNVGDKVEANQCVVVLEAMKMENEIMAPKSGKIVAVCTSQGASVNTGDALVSIG